MGKQVHRGGEVEKGVGAPQRAKHVQIDADVVIHLFEQTVAKHSYSQIDLAKRRAM